MARRSTRRFGSPAARARARAAAVAAGVIPTPGLPTPTPTPPATLTKPGQIGFNTISDDGQGASSFLYLNRMKSAANNGEWNNDAPLSQYAYPTAAGTGGRDTAAYVTLRRPTSGKVRYVLRHNGTNLDWSWVLTSNITIVDNSNPNRVLFDVGPAPGEAAPLLALRSATAWPDYKPANPIASRDGIAVYELAHEAAYLAGEQYYPEARAGMAISVATRFMDVQKANNNTAVTINDRTPVGNCTYSAGAKWGPPLEELIDRCNAGRTDLWVQVPIRANAEYRDWFYKTIRDRLDPALAVYLGTGNEVWNTGPGFDQSNTYAAQEGQKINQAWGADHGYGYLAARNAAEALAVFAGQEHRLRNVFERQAGNRAGMDAAAVGVAHINRKVRDLFTGMATGAYLGGPIQGLAETYRKKFTQGAPQADIDAANAARAALLSEVQYFEAHGVVSQQLLDQFRVGNTLTGWPNFNTLVALEQDVIVARDFCREHGIKHSWVYEEQDFHASLDIFGEEDLGTRANLMLEAAHNDPRWAGTAIGSGARDKKRMQRSHGQTMSMVLTDLGPNSKFGSWRTKETYLSADTPLWDFYEWYNVNGPDPVLFEINLLGGGAALTVGQKVALHVASFGGLTPAKPVTIAAGALPAGVTFAGGTLNGTPNAPPGNYPLTFQAIDAGGNVVQKTVAFTLAAAPATRPMRFARMVVLESADAGSRNFLCDIREIEFLRANGTVAPMAWSGDSLAVQTNGQQASEQTADKLGDGSVDTYWRSETLYDHPEGSDVRGAMAKVEDIAAVRITPGGPSSAPGKFALQVSVPSFAVDGSGGTKVIDFYEPDGSKWTAARTFAIV